MAGKWAPKDPNDIADYYVDWGSTDLTPQDRFLPDAVTITSATVTAATGVTVDEDDYTDKIQRIRFSGGEADHTYQVDLLIQTSDGQQFELTRTLTVKERVK